MWLSVFVVLFGAEINGEAERQTRQDTTAEDTLPIGQEAARRRGDSDKWVVPNATFREQRRRNSRT
jgi:hypothetical protein